MKNFQKLFQSDSHILFLKIYPKFCQESENQVLKFLENKSVKHSQFYKGIKENFEFGV